MADTGNFFGDTITRTVLCDTDLSAKQYYLVTLDSSDDNVVNLAAAATSVQFVLTEGANGSAASPKVGSIALGGRTKVTLGGTVGAGVPFMSDGNGKAIAATNGKYAAGILLKGGVSGDIVECLVTPGAVWTTVS